MSWKKTHGTSDQGTILGRYAMATKRHLYQAFSWRLLAFHGRSPLLRASIAILIFVPIWARTLGPHSFSLQSLGFMGILDADMFDIPINLLRVFWASAFVTVAGILFSITCPPVLRRYKNFQDWLDNDEQAYILRRTLTGQLGSEKSEEILERLQKKYVTVISDESFTRVWARYLILLFYLPAAWLSLRVLGAQVAAVREQTCWGQLFF